MSLSIIVAMSRNRVIGKENQLLWHLPNDVKRFKKMTIGHNIIMGRKTFESLRTILPGCHHIILTKNLQYQVEHKQVTVIHSVGALLSFINSNEEYFVIGGGEIFATLLPLCETLYITEIHKNYKGDTKFPRIKFKEWIIYSEEKGVMDDKNHLPHTFKTLKRIANS